MSTIRVRGLDIRRYARAIALAEQTLRPDGRGRAKHLALFQVAVCVIWKRIVRTLDAEQIAQTEATADNYLAALDAAKEAK